MIKEQYTGTGKVVLIAGGGRIFTDIAARFVRSERSLDEIVGSAYSKKIVQNILNCGHKAALEFDYFLFGVEGYSRVTEVQLVRKRLASYLIKSGRSELSGKRLYSVVYPQAINEFEAVVKIDTDLLVFPEGSALKKTNECEPFSLRLNASTINKLIEEWYEQGVNLGCPEEDLRYMKPQATEFKGIIGMNAHALHDWFSIRCCQNAQHEIRDMANKMLSLSKMHAPDVFESAGASCLQLGYCPENEAQNKKCKGKIITKAEAFLVLRKYKEEKNV